MLMKNSWKYVKKFVTYYYINSIKVMRRLFTIFLLLLLASCTKESIEVCGTVTSGYSDFDQFGREYFYLRLDGKRHRVDQKTYESYFIGDFICLE